jgi:PEP-CTERM motif
MKRLLCAAACTLLTAAAAAPALAATETLLFTADTGLHQVIPNGSPWASATITEDHGALDFLVHLNDGLFFYNSTPSLGFQLDKLGASISGISFNAAGTSSVVGGGTVAGMGTFNYGVTCTNCGIFGNLIGAPQADQVTFTVSHPTGLTLADVSNNPSGYAMALAAWAYLVIDDCPVAAEGSAGAFTAGVPEPSTWAMMLIGLVGLGFAFRSKRRISRFSVRPA